MNNRHLLAAAALVLLSALPKVYAATAFASFDGLAFSLQDLNKSDGISPSFQAIYEPNRTTSAELRFNFFGSVSDGNMGDLLRRPDGGVKYLWGSGDWSPPQEFGFVNAMSRYNPLSANSEIPDIGHVFALTPQSSVTFHVGMRTEVTGPSDARAWVSFNAYGIASKGEYDDTQLIDPYFFHASTGLETDTQNGDSFLSKVGVVTLSNPTDLPARFLYAVDMGILAYGDRVAAPVPEPEAYALMMLGGGLVLWRVRRRKGADTSKATEP